jgi:hypothetical protein
MGYVIVIFDSADEIVVQTIGPFLDQGTANDYIDEMTAIKPESSLVISVEPMIDPAAA